MKHLISKWTSFIVVLLSSHGAWAKDDKPADLEPNTFIQVWGRIGHIDWIGDDLFRHVVWAATFILVYLVKLTLEEKYDWKKKGGELAVIPISWLVTYGIALFELPMVIPALGLGGLAAALIWSKGIVRTRSDLKFWVKSEEEEVEKKKKIPSKTATNQKKDPKNGIKCPLCDKPHDKVYKFCQKCGKPPPGKQQTTKPPPSKRSTTSDAWDL